MVSEEVNKLNALPGHARVWIYQSDRKLTDAEVQHIEKAAEVFLKDWNTHGTKLSAGLVVIYNRFIVLAADEAVVAASGCSIDSSVRFLKTIAQELNIDLFDRLNIAYRNSTGEVVTLKMAAFEAAIQSGEITKETVVFNNLINTWDDLKSKWEVPALSSWHARMFNL